VCELRPVQQTAVQSEVSVLHQELSSRLHFRLYLGRTQRGFRALSTPRKDPGTKNRHVRFEVLMAIFLKIQIFWDITLCRMLNAYF